jgi:ribosomal protein L37AE/L43A
MGIAITQKSPPECPRCRRPTKIRTLETYAAGARTDDGHECCECGWKWAPHSSVAELHGETSVDGIDAEWPDP